MLYREDESIVVEGPVERGDQRGRELGYPTANVRVGYDEVPRDGVWAGVAHVGGVASAWIAAVSVGRRPTFYDRTGLRLLEAHLVGFHGDLYGRHVRVELQRHLRPMRAFASAESLVRQLEFDMVHTKAWARSRGLGALLEQQPHTHGASLMSLPS